MTGTEMEGKFLFFHHLFFLFFFFLMNFQLQCETFKCHTLFCPETVLLVPLLDIRADGGSVLPSTSTMINQIKRS